MSRSRYDQIGLRDKLYWRPWPRGLWHCYKRLAEEDRRPGERFVSLCHRETIPRSGGGATLRPPAGLRCGGCDAAEIKRRGKDESMDELPGWEELIPETGPAEGRRP